MLWNQIIANEQNATIIFSKNSRSWTKNNINKK